MINVRGPYSIVCVPLFNPNRDGHGPPDQRDRRITGPEDDKREVIETDLRRTHHPHSTSWRHGCRLSSRGLVAARVLPSLATMADQLKYYLWI